MVLVEEIQNVVREAGSLFTDRESAAQIKEKGACNYVTAVDEAVQSFLQKKLEILYPNIQFMAEEKDNHDIDMKGMVWVLDPVDGTTNLVHDYRNSAISLALVSDGETILGIVYNPYADEMYYAQKGKGSYCNGKAIHVSNAKTMKESLISVGTSPYFKEEADTNFNMFMHVFQDCQDIRRCGCASLDMVHVACGRIDGYLENHLKLWDYAAGTLIVREAGGEVLDYGGRNLSMTLEGECRSRQSVYFKYISSTVFKVKQNWLLYKSFAYISQNLDSKIIFLLL